VPAPPGPAARLAPRASAPGAAGLAGGAAVAAVPSSDRPAAAAAAGDEQPRVKRGRGSGAGGAAGDRAHIGGATTTATTAGGPAVPAAVEAAGSVAVDPVAAAAADLHVQRRTGRHRDRSRRRPAATGLPGAVAAAAPAADRGHAQRAHPGRHDERLLAAGVGVRAGRGRAAGRAVARGRAGRRRPARGRARGPAPPGRRPAPPAAARSARAAPLLSRPPSSASPGRRRPARCPLSLSLSMLASPLVIPLYPWPRATPGDALMGAVLCSSLGHGRPIDHEKPGIRPEIWRSFGSNSGSPAGSTPMLSWRQAGQGS